MEPKIAIDPTITDSNSQVSPSEMYSRHGGPTDTSLNGEGVTVVVQDSGLDEGHPWIDDAFNSVEFHDFTGEGHGDDVGHGTAVAELTGRYATGSDLIVNRVFGTSGSGSFGPFEQSFEWIKDNADRIDVLVMSWGASGRVPTIDSHVNEIANLGVIPVAASGNSGGSSGSPATARRCISVGALQEDGEKMTNFSSWDQNNDPDPGLKGVPEVSAIGKNVVLARASGTSMGNVIDEHRTVASGTSFSNPFTAGIVVDLVRQYGVDTVKQHLLRLENGADDIPGTHRDGLGRVNWTASRAIAHPDPPRQTETATVWSLFGDNDWIQIDGDLLPNGEYVIDVATFKDSFTAADE